MIRLTTILAVIVCAPTTGCVVDSVPLDGRRCEVASADPSQGCGVGYRCVCDGDDGCRCLPDDGLRKNGLPPDAGRSQVNDANDAQINADGQQDALVQFPPFGGSSGGSGGRIAPVAIIQLGMAIALLAIPDGYSEDTPASLLFVVPGGRGAEQMLDDIQRTIRFRTQDLSQTMIVAADGLARTSALLAAEMLEAIREQYNIDNDRTYLLSDGAGTGVGMELGFELMQGYFAAFWANDVDQSGVPMRTASDLGFRPWGNVGVGDSRTLAETTLRAMAEADYRLPEDAPFESSYSGLMGPSSREQELTAALSFLEQKSRR